jgi:hypothetical protein
MIFDIEKEKTIIGRGGGTSGHRGLMGRTFSIFAKVKEHSFSIQLSNTI